MTRRLQLYTDQAQDNFPPLYPDIYQWRDSFPGLVMLTFPLGMLGLLFFLDLEGLVFGKGLDGCRCRLGLVSSTS
jgi:hypothetical protein